MTFEQISAELDQKKYRPIYFLMGEEAYFIDQLTHRLEHEVLSESERSFNQSVLYGKDVKVMDIIGKAKRFPMMAPHQVVIVKEAQHVRNIDELQAYAENPQPTTVLVIAHKYKKLDKRKTLAKILAKSHVLFESKKLYDNQVAEWLTRVIRTKGYSISPKAAALLTEFVGSDLGRLAQELEKLMIVIPPGGEITAESIERNIGISKDYNNFELLRAIGVKDILKANRIALYFSRNPKDNPLVVTIAMVHSYFVKVLLVHANSRTGSAALAGILKVSPYFVREYQAAAGKYPLNKCKRIIGYIREADGRSKGVDSGSMTDGDVLKELIFKILH